MLYEDQIQRMQRIDSPSKHPDYILQFSENCVINVGAGAEILLPTYTFFLVCMYFSWTSSHSI